VPDITREQCDICGHLHLNREFAVRNDRAAMTLHVRSRSSVVQSGDGHLVMWRVRPSFFRSAARGLHVRANLTREIYETRGAEAPGQRTAASRLLRRVSRLFGFFGE
jgi:hypothetical protein